MERPMAPPAPPLSDGVIVLRPLRRGDAPALASIWGHADDELAYWMDGVPQPYTIADAHAYLARVEGGWRGAGRLTPFAVCDAATAELLGWVGLRWDDAAQGVAEAGYWTRREARGRGVATRATRLAAAWVLRDLGFERIELLIDARNKASRRVAEKAGFALDGVRRSARRNARDGRRTDEAIYSLLRGELRESGNG
jgi:RimJ/RimL family protein N-acetyltransferase